jgi:hypothetical protein
LVESGNATKGLRKINRADCGSRQRELLVRGPRNRIGHELLFDI